jgi:hypothetical protein
MSGRAKSFFAQTMDTPSFEPKPPTAALPAVFKQRARRMTNHEAACSCGQLRLICQDDPVRVSMCHCLECQRRTGSTFGVQAWFMREQVRLASLKAQTKGMRVRRTAVGS